MFIRKEISLFIVYLMLESVVFCYFYRIFFFKCLFFLLCWYICILLAFDVYRMLGNVLWFNL